MTSARSNLFTRDDTFFGVCEGLGEDLRVNADLLRLGFALALFFSPVLTVATYAGLGVILLVARLVFPVRRTAPAQEVTTPRATGNDQGWIELAEAA